LTKRVAYQLYFEIIAFASYSRNGCEPIREQTTKGI